MNPSFFVCFINPPSDGNNLVGPIPAYIFSALPKLAELDLSDNSLSGTITTFVSYNQHGTYPPRLSGLNIKENYVTGPVPEELPESLLTMEMQNNDIVDNLEWIESLTNIRILHANNNNFYGDIPNSLSG